MRTVLRSVADFVGKTATPWWRPLIATGWILFATSFFLPTPETIVTLRVARTSGRTWLLRVMAGAAVFNLWGLGGSGSLHVGYHAWEASFILIAVGLRVCGRHPSSATMVTSAA